VVKKKNGKDSLDPGTRRAKIEGKSEGFGVTAIGPVKQVEKGRTKVERRQNIPQRGDT